MTYYKQCTLSKGTARDNAWIPEEFAKRGKTLKVRGEDGWKVLMVGDLRRSEEYLVDHGRDHLMHRTRTDI